MVYTGSNSADLDAAITDFVITSESGGVLHFDSGGSSFTANTSNQVIFLQGFVYAVFTQSQYENYYSEITVKSASLKSAGIATAPTLILDIPATVSVDITPAMPDASYTPHVDLFGGTDLSSIIINSVTVIDTNTVDVSVQTSLASFNGLQILVTAT
jgi:hypothetical protein